MSNGTEKASGPSNLVLLGFMGSGKTSTGLVLSRLLGFRFVDMDAVLEEREGLPVSGIFEKKGEAHFRRIEKELVSELLSASRQVIATGGGAWMDPGNRDRLLAGGRCVWLKVSAAQVWERVKGDLSTRPLLSRSPDPLATIRSMLAEREPLYALATFTVETDGATPESVARRILERMAGENP